MHLYCTSKPIDSMNIKHIQYLKQRLEILTNYIKSLEANSNLTNNLLKQIHFDVEQRNTLRNNYYHRTYPLLLKQLCSIKSNKQHFQLTEKESYYSKQFFKKIFNIQFLINIDQYNQNYEQSNIILNNLKSSIQEYENDIDQLKEKLIEQTKQIDIYSTKLFQIQLEQNQIQTNIQQLKQQISLEKKLLFTNDHIQSQKVSTTFNNKVYNEYVNLCTQISQITYNIEQKLIDLYPLQFELYIYHTILNRNHIHIVKESDQTLLVPTTTTTSENTDEIDRQSASVINQLDENLINTKQEQQLPIEIQNKTEYTKIKSRKSK